MKSFAKKGFLQKIIITVVVALLLSNFIVPTYSHADWGGVLISPVVDLLCSIGDAVINLLQRCMTGTFGSKEVDFSMSAFMVEDDKFFSEPEYSEYQGSAGGSSYTETINIDPSGDKNHPNPNEFERGWLNSSNKYHVPVATYSPEQIFAGNVAGLDINFIKPNTYEGQDESSASKLQPTIAAWYVALRNLTVVGLLSVLVYVAIRIILSSTAADKAKYKQMLTDWLIALCLLFFLHYIMSFVITMTESICNAIAGDGQTGITVTVQSSENSSGTFKTNLLGLARFKTQYADFGQKMAYLIMYLALVIYTCIFTWFYLKRLLMMAFLTLIAPLVALTYPIDKISDGKAQAFDSWIKEYVFNALIQPFHLIIYTVFIGTAMDLAANNIIYMIAALGFIMPAEKILRKFFGFEKAGSTLGALGGFTAASLLGKLGKGGGSKGGAKQGSKDDSSGDKQKPPKFERRHDVNQIDDGSGNTPTGGQEGQGGENGAPPPDTALDKYEAEGYGKNDAGEYYNPWTDEYDPNYDPHNDAAYAQQGQASQQQNENGQGQPAQQQNNSNNEQNRNQEAETQRKHRIMNLARAHGINARSLAGGAYRGGKRAIGGVMRFGTKTAFKAAGGTVAGAVALATGRGLAGASAAAFAGANLGGKLGDGIANTAGMAWRGVEAVGRGARRVGRAIHADATAPNSEEGLRAAENELFGGTRLGRELDQANGNTRYQTAGEARDIKRDENNIQYVRDYMAAKNGGVMPSDREVRAQMNSFDPYLAEGLTDIKDMLKAQKAESIGISSKQAAIIAAIGKERGITADILNDDKKATAQRANLQQEFINKGYSKEAASQRADYTMNVLKVQNGVANSIQGGTTTQTSRQPESRQQSNPQPRQPSQPRQPRNSGNNNRQNRS